MAGYLFAASCMCAVLGAAAAIAQDEAVAETPAVQLEGEEQPTEDTSASPAREIFVGAGIGFSHSLSGERATEFSLTELSSGDVYTQVQKSEKSDIRVLFETHYAFQDVSAVAPNVSAWDRVSALAACGPFALVTTTNSSRSGCGPFAAVALEPDGEVAEFGLGWYVGFENADGREGFGIGVGILVDPDSNLVDTRVVDPDTYLVRPQFRDSVLQEQVTPFTQETSVSVLVMVSRSFWSGGS